MCEKKQDVIEAVIKKLQQGNQVFVTAEKNPGDVSPKVRSKNVEAGQKPDAVVVTCSDSRVPPEHIFSAGIGELFVIRTAGNVIGDFELGSIEYAVGHLGTSVVLVLGHNHCGAVAAAMQGHGHGYITSIVEEIQPAIVGEENVATCENLNIDNSIKRILQSEAINERINAGEVRVLGAKYNLESGVVEFFG
ncbi:carbonic anhydrase [Acetobacterium wieringae]|uniref:Carbonic anhydrase n=1 Tax=Acetobacterium wieringae TaxID=52694 RepID=A0A1F2PID2_9FIRM|nr:carbonic anhydrase [Acetobacterium wieringae]MEA4805721.1 carbonic anhydrase [Acetobacterium wieringae]OFV71093.1 carbonic anhydrase 2 [Acetobacterium wieringae]TYC84232.1 carbonic anhydrase [Acetobacterium wieringae]URN84033.1 carbonic anhydrase [Acetobacterium wieringae]